MTTCLFIIVKFPRGLEAEDLVTFQRVNEHGAPVVDELKFPSLISFKRKQNWQRHNNKKSDVMVRKTKMFSKRILKCRNMEQ